MLRSKNLIVTEFHVSTFHTASRGVRRHLHNATVMTVLLSKPNVYARPSTGASKVSVLLEPLVSSILVVRLTLPSGKTVGVMVQARPSAKVWLLGLPLETSIIPKSLFFGRLAVCECLEQPVNANVSDARIISGV
jgi:hypothetical protein